MKNFICLLSIIVVSFHATAQFSVTRLNGTPINNGDLIVVTGLSAAEAEIKFKVTNTSDTQTINLKIQVEQMINADGSNFQLCFGDLCFFSVTAGTSYPPNFPLTLGPGESNGNFDHFWNSNTGNGQNLPLDYVLRFIQLNDQGTEIGNSVRITYRYQPNLNVSEFENLKNMGIYLNQTVVINSLEFNSTIDLNTSVNDMNGKIISRNSFTAGNNSINFSDLPAAVYFIRFNDNLGKSGSIKIVKK